MKKLFVAKNIGFCEGVKRSINLAYRMRQETRGRVFIDGPIVHNASVVNKLSKVGVTQLTNDVQLSNDDSIVIRAHGVTKERKILLESLQSRLMDATCPKVLRIIGLVKRYIQEGYFIVLVGEPTHPEVIGICSYVDSNKILVISNEEELTSLKSSSVPVLILAQTTCNLDLFVRISEKVKNLFTNVRVINTICTATQERQSEVKTLIELGCDLIIIVGSKFSKNTNELAYIVTANRCSAIISENLNELDIEAINNATIVGLTSGASADIAEVQEIRNYLLSLIPEKSLESL